MPFLESVRSLFLDGIGSFDRSPRTTTKPASDESVHPHNLESVRQSLQAQL
jgi:hypothetical protein